MTASAGRLYLTSGVLNLFLVSLSLPFSRLLRCSRCRVANFYLRFNKLISFIPGNIFRLDSLIGLWRVFGWRGGVAIFRLFRGAFFFLAHVIYKNLAAFSAHVNGAALLPIAGFPESGLQDPFHKNRPALLQVLAASLRLFIPNRDRQKTNLFFQFTAAILESSVDRQAQIGHRRSVGEIGRAH